MKAAAPVIVVLPDSELFTCQKIYLTILRFYLYNEYYGSFAGALLMLRKPIIATLSVLLLLTNALAPAISAASQMVQNRAKKVVVPVPKPMVGVPVVDFSQHGGPSKSPYAENLSKLNDQLQLRANITPADIRTWTKLAASSTPSRTKARALIYLAEVQLAAEQPQKASRLYQSSCSPSTWHHTEMCIRDRRSNAAGNVGLCPCTFSDLSCVLKESRKDRTRGTLGLCIFCRVSYLSEDLAFAKYR